MNIWIVNQYASTLETGFGGRWYYLAREMAKQGHSVKIFASANHHLLKVKPRLDDQAVKVEKIDGFSFIWLKTKDYDDAHSKFGRIYSEFQFKNIIKELPIKSDDKPDIIIYSSPSLIGYSGAYHLSKNIGCKIILDIRDLWPLTLTEIGIPKYHPFIIYLSFLERYAYNTCSHIISNWPFAINYIKKFNILDGKFDWVPNGFSVDEFLSPTELEDKIKKQIPNNKFIVGYTGTLGRANALGSFIKAASLLKEHKDIYFMIVGDGKEKEELNIMSNQLGCSNVIFLDSINKKQIPSLLNYFSVCYVGFLGIPLYQYGSSLTKLPEYLVSRKPIVYASSSIFQPILDYKAGVTVPAEDSEAIAKAILDLYSLNESDRKSMGDNGYSAAVDNYEYKNLSIRVMNIVNRVISL